MAIKQYDISLLETMENLKDLDIDNYQIGHAVYFAILQNQFTQNKLYSKGPKYAKKFRINEAIAIQNALVDLMNKQIGLTSINSNFELALEERLISTSQHKRITRLNHLHDVIVFLQQRYDNPHNIRIYMGEQVVQSYTLPLIDNARNLYQNLFKRIHHNIKDQYHISIQIPFSK